MELLQSRDKKYAHAKNVKAFKDYIMMEARRQNVKFIKKRRPIELIIGASITAIFVIVFYIFGKTIPIFKDGNMLINLLIAFLPIIIGASISGGKKSSITKFNRKQVDRFSKLRDEVLIETFNLRYDDIKIIKRLSHQEITRILVPGLVSVYSNNWINGKDHDSRLHRAYGGYVFKTKNNVILNVFEIEVRQTHYSDGDQHFVDQDYICVTIENFPDRWKDVNFIINQDEETFNTPLENQQFNKEWNYYFDDEMNLRYLLTPWVQEQLVKAKFRYTLKHQNNLMHWYGMDYDKVMISNFDMAQTFEHTINNIAKDVLKDLANIEALIQDLSIYKTVVS